MKQIQLLICFLMFLLLSSCRGSENTLDVGGFKFGASKDEILNIAKSCNYTIDQPYPHRIILKGKIEALGMIWNELDIMVDDERGVKQIVLDHPLNTLTQDEKENHFKTLAKLFPNSSKQGYIASLYVIDPISGERGPTIESNSGIIFDIKDEKDKYTGWCGFIKSQNRFYTLICSKTPK